MLGHAIEVLIAQQDGETTLLEFWLDNEEYLELSNEPGLFAKIKTKKDLLSQIPSAFKHPDGDVEDIAAFIKEFDYYQNYAKFEKAVRKISLDTIAAIIVMTVRNLEYSEDKYKCEWVKYSINPYAISSGAEYCQSSYDPERIIRSLFAANAEKRSSENSNSSEHNIVEQQAASIVEDSMDLQEGQAEEKPFDPKAFEKKMNKVGEQWLDVYGRFVTKNPSISFSGKTFVLSGVEALEDEYQLSLENEITSRGGFVRKSISGKTDYLVVDPCWSGESKIKTAIEQMLKGKPISVIDSRDLIEFIKTGINLDKVQNADIEGKNETVTIPGPEKYDNINGFILRGSKLVKYHGTDIEIVIPEGITEIDNFAFDKSKASTIILPSSIVKIGSYAFSNCKKIKKIDIPDSVTIVGDNVFSNCTKLSKIRWSKNTTQLPQNAFYNCLALKEIMIPEGVSEIGESAFMFCKSLVDVYLPTSIRLIAKRAFLGADTIKIHCYEGCYAEIYAKENRFPFECRQDLTARQVMDMIKDANDEAYVTEGQKLVSYLGNADIAIIPGNISVIGSGAFTGNEFVRTIELPRTVVQIELDAFCNCPNLSRVIIPVNLKNIAAGAFQNCPNLCIDTVEYSYAERYGKIYGIAVITNGIYGRRPEITAALAKAKQRAAEAARKRKEEEEQRLEAERQKAAEQKRLAELEARRLRYSQLMDQIYEQNQIINQNSGWFGSKARIRKEAQVKLAELESMVEKEFPNGRP